MSDGDGQRRMSVVIRIFAYVLFAVSTALSVSCTGNRDASEDVELIVEQIRRADQALLQAEEQRDLESAMALVAPHAVFQPPGLPAIVGHEAIRRFYEEQWFTLPYVEMFGKADTVVVAASGDLEYLDGRSHLMLEISGEHVVSEGKYLGVWQRTEGHWRLVAISWTANEPAR
jgi:ketosteroid isomerase-like protein